MPLEIDVEATVRATVANFFEGALGAARTSWRSDPKRRAQKGILTSSMFLQYATAKSLLLGSIGRGGDPLCSTW